MFKKMKIDEEMGLHKHWKKSAENVTTPAELKQFAENLIHMYEHDYGTIVHATTALMIAAFNVMENSGQGGMTGFQASCIGWTMVRKFMGLSDGPIRILDADNLLYPQYGYRFTTIPKSWPEWIKKQARERLKEHEGMDNVHAEVLAHWNKISLGEIPFGLKVSDE